MRTLLALIAASASLIGCVGDVSMPDDTDTDTPAPTPVNPPQDTSNPAGGDLTIPKKKYDDNVHSILQAKCGSSGCHAQAQTTGSITKFVATNPADGWKLASETVALRGTFTASAAPVLTMIKGGTHKGVTYTTDEEAKIVDWLDAEVSARNGQPATNPTNPGTETLSQATERVLSAFAGCMTPQNFQQANMVAWGNVNAQNNQQCENCHATGGEGFIASRNETFMWNVFSNRKYYFLQYLTVDLLGGPAAAKVIINETSFRGVATAQAPHQEHPTFNAGPNSQGMQALRQFYDSVMAKKTAGTCGAPRPFPM